MFIRMKSSILGALGSFVTVILMYHILKLSTHQVYTRYLDSTEITNYTLLESLFSVQSYHNHIESESQSIHNTPTFKELEEYDLDKLKSTFMIPISSNISTTFIIQYDSYPLATLQLDFLLRQTMSPTVIYIVCSEKEKHAIQNLIQEKEKEFHINNVIQPIVTAKDDKSSWLNSVHQYDIQTDFVVLLDNNQILPGIKYIEFIIRLLHTKTFGEAIVGTENNNCQQTNKAHYVKSIQDVWVLRREWFLALLLSSSSSSPSNDISLDLYQSLQIPSVLIPSDDILTGNSFRRKNETECIDSSFVSNEDGSVAFYMENQSSPALEELMCQFGAQHQIVHLITNSAQINLPTCALQKVHLEHHFVSSRKEFDIVINQVKAQIVIYQESNSKILHDTSTFDATTFIKLPTLEHHSDVGWLTTLPIETLKHWNTPTVKLIITTSGSKKSSQVKRIFNSIKNANYLGDQVDISILMDEKSDGLTTKFVNNLQWSIGNKQIRHRISSVHPMQVFAEAWYPSNDHEYAVMLDDRVELSKSFYIWIKYNLLKYRYSRITNKQMFGISLYSPRIIDTDPSGRLLLLPPSASGQSPYLMQVPCSSGSLYFPEHWREFHDYITARITDQATVKRGSGNKHLFKDSLLTISKTNRWINSWRKYFDEMVYMRGYVMLYPSIHTSYSTLYINLNKKQKTLYSSVEKLYNVPLSQTLPTSLPDLKDLPVLDLHGKPTDTDTLINRGIKLQRKFSACNPRNNTNTFDASDMICPFNQLIQIPIEESIESVPIKSVNLYI